MSNMGKFKIVVIVGINQWFLIDQFGKFLFVLGGQNDEVLVVQDIIFMFLNIISFFMYDQFNGMGFLMSNASDILLINSFFNVFDNDLEVDDVGGDSVDYLFFFLEVKVLELLDVINSESRFSFLLGRGIFQVVFDEDVIYIGDVVDEAVISMEKMSLELKDI